MAYITKCLRDALEICLQDYLGIIPKSKCQNIGNILTFGENQKCSQGPKMQNKPSFLGIKVFPKSPSAIWEKSQIISVDIDLYTIHLSTPSPPLQYRGGDPRDISLWTRRSKRGLTWHSGLVWIQMLDALVGHIISVTSVHFNFWHHNPFSKYTCCSYRTHQRHKISVQSCDITIHASALLAWHEYSHRV